MENKTITFGQLSFFLKIAIILAWIGGSIISVTFLVGFMQGLLGA